MKHINKKQKIGILGFGNMGKAIFKLLQQQNEFKKNTIFFIHSLGVKNIKGAICVKSVEELCHTSDVLFLCVKPQNFYKFAPLKISNSKKLIIISIMAGVPVTCIKKIFSGSRVVRTMPNLPLQVGQALIGWYADKSRFSASDLLFVKQIFSYFGKSIEVNKEKMLDAITAVSGSGPAYVFLFINALIKAAQNLGFNKKQSEEIVLQTVTGSVAYLLEQDKIGLEQLIKKVTSKKGTTHAALQQLNVVAHQKQWQKAVDKAYRRARELSAYDSKRT